jgi:hypothetical protein
VGGSSPCSNVSRKNLSVEIKFVFPDAFAPTIKFSGPGFTAMAGEPKLLKPSIVTLGIICGFQRISLAARIKVPVFSSDREQFYVSTRWFTKNPVI